MKNQLVKKWEFCTARMLEGELEIETNRKINIIILYGPSEDEKVAIKDIFWEVELILQEVQKE